MSVVLVCSCGKRLRAPGATPGRVGRCPSCGGALRVPDAATAAEGPSLVPAEPAGGSYDLGPATGAGAPVPADRPETEPPGSAPAAFVARRSRRRKPVDSPEDDWDGLVRRPSRPETKLATSFLYPLWDWSGLIGIVGVPLILGPLTLACYALWDVVQMGGIFVLGTLGLLAAGSAGILAYLGLHLNGVLRTSARGEIQHRRWPDLEWFSLLGATVRWGWVLISGLAVGLPLAAAYASVRFGIVAVDRLAFAVCATVGAGYAQMALLAVVMFDDLRAANPIRVGRAIKRLGGRYAAPCLVTGLGLTALAGFLELLVRYAGAWVAIGGVWLFWVLAVYLAMVALRVLGVTYFQNAGRLGWFPDRPTWGAS